MTLEEATNNAKNVKIVKVISDALIDGDAKTEGGLFLCCTNSITEGVHYNEFTEILGLLMKFGEVKLSMLSDKHYISNYTI